MEKGRQAARLAASAGASAALAFILLAVFNPASPLSGMRSFFLGPLRNSFSIGNLLSSAVGIAFSGLGAALAFKAGIVNLGGEGYIYAGAVAGYAFASSASSLNPAIGLPLACACAFLSCSALGSLPTLLRRHSGWNELISSFILAQAVIPVMDWAIASPLRDRGSQIVATAALPELWRFARILPPSALDASAFVCLLACLAAFAAGNRSYWGFRQRTVGQAPDFAEAVGIEVGRERAIALAISSGVMGLGGFLSMLASHGRVIRSFSGGMGWSGLACAIVAGSNPLLIPPVAVLFAYLDSGATNAQMSAGIPTELSGLVQALVFFIAASKGLRERRGSAHA